MEGAAIADVVVVDVVKALLVVAATVVLGKAVVVDTVLLALLSVDVVPLFEDVELVEPACGPGIEDAVVVLENPKLLILEPLEAMLVDLEDPGTEDEDVLVDELGVDAVEAVPELDNRNPYVGNKDSREVVRLGVEVQLLDQVE